MPTVSDVLSDAVENIEPHKFSWEGLARVIFLIVVGILLIRIILKFVNRMLNHSKMPAHIHRYILLVVKVLLWTLLALTVLGSIGAEVTSIIALLSVAGLAVSLALQNTLANWAGGIVLMVVKPFQIGHYIIVDGVEGTVSALGLSYTTLITVDNREVFIPNSQLSSAKITNNTALGKRRLDLIFSASYDDPTQDVIDAIQDAISRVPEIWRDPAPMVHLKAFKSSCIDYEMRVYIEPKNYWTVYFAIHEGVRDAFERHGVHMTYDHLTVHMVGDE